MSRLTTNHRRKGAVYTMGRSHADRAKEAVEKGTWLELAWANVTKAKFLDIIYESAREASETLPFFTFRLNSLNRSKPITFGSWLAEPVEELGPLVVSRLCNKRVWKEIQFAVLHGLDVGEPLYPRLISAGASENIIRTLAGSPYPEDRDEAFALFANAKERPRTYDTYGDLATDKLLMAFGFARQNDPRGDEVLTEQLRHFGDLETARNKDDGFALLLRAIQHRKESDKAGEWALLLTDCFECGLETFITLGDLVEGPLDKVIQRRLNQFLSELIDDAAQTRAWRVAAQAVLARDPRAAKKLKRDDADWLIAHLHPEPYSWNKHEQVALIHRLCAEILLRIGDKEALAWIKSLRYTSSPQLLQVVNQARSQSGDAPIEKLYYSEDMCKELVKRQGAEALLSIVEEATHNGHEPLSVLRDLAAKDEALQQRLTEFAIKLMESVHNYSIHRIDSIHEDIRFALYFLEDLPTQTKKELFKDTTSLWIRDKCLEEEIDYPERPSPSYPNGASVQSLSAPAFAYAGPILDMAISPDGTLLCVGGDRQKALYDVETGKFLKATDGYGYCRTCAFSPTGKEIAFGDQYKEVQTYSLQEETTKDLYKHGHIVEALAYNHDGTRLASVDAGGELVLWDVKKGKELWQLKVRGAFHDVLFLPDDRVFASYSAKATKKGQSFYLLLVEAEGEKSKKFKQESPITAMAQHHDNPERIATGSAAGGLAIGQIRGKKFTQTQEYVLDTAHIKALDWQDDALWLATKEGLLARAVPNEETLNIEEVEEIAKVEAKGTALHALLCAGGVTYAAGSLGRVLTAEDGAPPELPTTHNARIQGWTSLSDGTLLTLDWDGRILRWAPGADTPTFVIDLAASAESIVHIDDETVVVGTRKGMRLVDLTQQKVIAKTEGDTRLVVGFDDVIAHNTAEGISFAKVDGLAPAAQSDIALRGVKSLAVSPNGLRILVGCGSGHVGVWTRGEWLWFAQCHGADRLDLGKPHMEVANVLFSPDGKFAVSGASDNTVRVCDAEHGEQLLRIQGRFGLFNRMSIDPGSRFCAIPDGHSLTVLDLVEKQIVCKLTAEEFGDSPLDAAIFTDDGRFFVADEGGKLYQVTLPQ